MKIYFAIFIILIITACNYKPIIDNYVPKYTTSQLVSKLEKYYTLKNADSMLIFLNNWNSSIPHATNEYINQNDTLTNLYNAFGTFYPTKIRQYGNQDLSDINYKYLLIQNEIKYAVISDNKLQFLEKNIDSINNLFYNPKIKIFKQISNFRPPCYNDNFKFLYFTNEYDEAFKAFFKYKTNKQGEIEYMSIDRLMFIKTSCLMDLYNNYFFNQYYPMYVEGIVFNENFTEGFIRSSSIGGRVPCFSIIKKENKWIQRDSKVLIEAF